jgi:hypothetical protein
VNQPTYADRSDSVPPLLGPLALVCWIASLFLPAMSAPQGWILGGEFAVKGLMTFPLAIFFSPLLALTPLTNLIFLGNLLRLWSLDNLKSANATWVGRALLFNCIALVVGNANPALGDVVKYPAMWLWLLSFALLYIAVKRSELGHSGTPIVILKDRWKLAVALSCAIAIVGLTARTMMFPGPTISRTVSNVEGIEIRRSGVPLRHYPLLEDGYLRQSKYKFFVLDGHTHESLPGGGWIIRPGVSPVRSIVHEAVDSYRLDPEGPGEVQRSTVTIYDGGEIVARKTFYQGMIEDGHGWVGAIALKFVQSVLQPGSSLASGESHRAVLPVHSVDLPSDFKLTDAKRNILGCPSSVVLNPNDWRELRTLQWSLQAMENIQAVACGEDSVLVVLGNDTGVTVDVISLDGRAVVQARANVSQHTNLYALEDARASKSGWRIRLVSYRPGPSIDQPTVPIERFEIALESKEPS